MTSRSDSSRNHELGLIKDALRIAGVGLWERDIKTNLVNYDSSWLAMLGYKSGELPANLSEWEKRIHPDDKEIVMSVLKSFLAGETQIYQTDHRLLAKSGNYIWVRDTAEIVERDANGSPQFAVGTHMNISAMKRIEAQSNFYLERQLLISRVATTLNYTNDFPQAVNTALQLIGEFENISRIYIFEDNLQEGTTSNTFEWCNLGINPEMDNLQTFPYEFIPSWNPLLNEKGLIRADNIEEQLPDDIVEVLAPQNIKSIIVLPIEYSYKNRIGFIGFDQCGTSRIWSDSEEELLRSCAGLLSNAFKRNFSERLLYMSRLHYESLVESQRECILRIDMDGRLTFANKAFLAAIGMKDIKEEKHIFLDFICVEERTDFNKEMDSLQLGKTSTYFENRLLSTAGEKWYGWDASYLSIVKTETYEIQLVGRDITQQKEDYLHLENAKLKAQKASEMKSMFLSKISHELRTPLNSIIGYSDLLERTVKETKSMSYISSLVSSSRKLKVLIDDLLDFTKIESNKHKPNLSEFGIRELFQDLLKSFEVVIPIGVKLKSEVDQDLPAKISFDQIKLYQILNNLISNALKFTKEGEVIVKLKQIPEEPDFITLRLEIEDTGIGIPSDKINFVFNSFEQVDSSGYRSFTGTGLGLSIVKAYVELFNGDIKLTSEVDKGTRIIIDLPGIRVVDEINDPDPDPDSSFVSRLADKLRGTKILIADDDSQSLALMVRYLKEMKAELLLVSNGKEALEVARIELPQVFLLDLDMPGINGFQVAKEIRGNPILRKAQIVAITGVKDLLVEMDLFDGFILKPFNEGELVKKLHSLLPQRIEIIENLTVDFQGLIKIFTKSKQATEKILELYLKGFKTMKLSKRIADIEAFSIELQSLRELFTEPEFESLIIEFSEATEVLNIKKLEALMNQFDFICKNIYNDHPYEGSIT